MLNSCGGTAACTTARGSTRHRSLPAAELSGSRPGCRPTSGGCNSSCASRGDSGTLAELGSSAGSITSGRQRQRQDRRWQKQQQRRRCWRRWQQQCAATSRPCWRLLCVSGISRRHHWCAASSCSRRLCCCECAAAVPSQEATRAASRQRQAIQVIHKQVRVVRLPGCNHTYFSTEVTESGACRSGWQRLMGSRLLERIGHRNAPSSWQLFVASIGCFDCTTCSNSDPGSDLACEVQSTPGRVWPGRDLWPFKASICICGRTAAACRRRLAPGDDGQAADPAGVTISRCNCPSGREG